MFSCNAQPHAIAVDSLGNAYVTGSTDSPQFPTTPGAIQTVLRSRGNAFVMKLNNTGSALVYSTYLGGSRGEGGASGEVGYGIAVDTSGSAYVAGSTSSVDFPTTPGAFQTTNVSNPGVLGGKAFVAKLNTSGTALVYSTYLGGTNYLVAGAVVQGDAAYGIAVDSAGNAFVTGPATTSDFPTTPGAFQTPAPDGVYHAFAAKLNATGTGLVYSTYLDDPDENYDGRIALDPAGHAYITAGLSNACVTELDETGSNRLGRICLWASSGGVTPQGIALYPLGNVYMTGSTGSGFYVTPGAFQTDHNGGAFVDKINFAATPQITHSLDTATVNINCNSYTVTLIGKVDGPNPFVGYAFGAKGFFGGNEDIPVSPGSDGHFTITVTRSIGPITRDGVISGTATLFSNQGFNTIPNQFSWYGGRDTLRLHPTRQYCFGVTTTEYKRLEQYERDRYAERH